MEWLQRMMDAVEYMEEHLEGPIDLEKVAKVACSSPFHFQRIFYVITGNTVVEYIRKRRLTLAAQELAAKKAKVIEVALKYGYETPESFTKAFKRVHGISPASARVPGTNLKAFPRISFHISLKGDQDMDYKIIEQKAFRVAGKIIKVSTKDGENFRKIPEFWSNCNQDGTCDKLCTDFKASEILGICMDIEQEKERFNYMIAVKTEATNIDNQWAVRTIPASTWAVFPSIGPMPGAIQKVWERIFQEWFPATGYEHAAASELEVYPAGDTKTEDYYCEVWIPILKK